MKVQSPGYGPAIYISSSESFHIFCSYVRVTPMTPVLLESLVSYSSVDAALTEGSEMPTLSK